MVLLLIETAFAAFLIFLAFKIKRTHEGGLFIDYFAWVLIVGGAIIGTYSTSGESIGLTVGNLAGGIMYAVGVLAQLIAFDEAERKYLKKHL